MVGDLVKRLDSVVYDMILWLRQKASEFKAQRKYKEANRLSSLAADLGADFKVLKHYSIKEDNKVKLLEAYGEFYHVCVKILNEVGDINIDKAYEFYSKAIDLATDLVLRVLRGD